MTVGGPTITLSNGVKMPQVGLGTWMSPPAEAKAAVKTAVETGYRLIDTAAVYQNEEAIGEAIKELIQAGKVTREELFITTKIGSGPSAKLGHFFPHHFMIVPPRKKKNIGSQRVGSMFWNKKRNELRRRAQA
ncbi:oxidoreductase, aldo/keto reductase family protein [Cooperia oncophora]